MSATSNVSISVDPKSSENSATKTDNFDVDDEIEAMKKRLQEMEDEAKKIKAMQTEAENELTSSFGESKDSIDARSVHVGSVDYSTTPEELQSFFQSCGTINRVTILCDKVTGRPKGFAFVEFAEAEAVDEALKMNDTLFKNRQIKVSSKRSNVPRFMLNRGGGRGSYRGGYRGGNYRGRYRGRKFQPY
jgi:polyadenylate-binding protein 2